MRKDIDDALQKVTTEVLEGLKHGFFECSITCETIKGNDRRLLLKSGKSHSFVLKKEDIDRYN